MINKLIFLLLLFTMLNGNLYAQKKGCTDVQAANYDSAAKLNDGSCIYPTTSYSPKVVCSKLSDTLMETSGLIFYNNWFWTLNDSGNDPLIYAFDSTKGNIIHKTFIPGKANIDWEEITQDASNIYIGEFGNNNGDRKDLKIYILKKSDLKLNLKTDTASVGEILFSYADQGSFVPANQNHNFDMEAMCVIGDSIHLFSKDWVDKKTRHYVLPVKAGTYTLIPRESILVDGQITSACTNASGDKIILGGYNTSNGACFMWMLWDFKDNMVFNGHKRRIELGNAFTLGQYEGTAFKTNQLYFTNEKRFTDQGLWQAEINQWFTPKGTSSLDTRIIVTKFVAYQKGDNLVIESSNTNGYITIYNSVGVKMISQKIKKYITVIALESFSSGVYTIEINREVQKIVIEK